MVLVNFVTDKKVKKILNNQLIKLVSRVTQIDVVRNGDNICNVNEDGTMKE